MSVALAIRLAMLSHLSNVKIGFFDEPTTNLDGQRRMALAEVLPTVTAGVDQLFVISHDDTFDSITEHTLTVKKELGGSKVSRQI